MKRKILLVSFAVLLMTGFCGSCSKADYDIYASIDGFVYDDANGEPLRGVTITITPGGKNMLTGSDGFFNFTDLDPQQYSISAQKAGYSSNRRTVTGVAGEAVHVTLTMLKNE